MHNQRNDAVDGDGAESTQPNDAAHPTVLPEPRGLHSGAPSGSLDLSAVLRQCARRYR